MLHLVIALGSYFFSLLAAFLIRILWVRVGKQKFAIPYDRLPIALALLLLLAAAGALAGGNEASANELAITAYCLLILGVGLQIFTYIREQRRGAKTHEHSEKGDKISGLSGNTHPSSGVNFKCNKPKD